MKYLPLYLMVSLALSACSSNELIDSLPDNRPNYKTSRITNPLEIPPDLTQSSIDDTLTVAELSATESASLAVYQGERSGQAQQADRLADSLRNIQSNGDATWIEIDANPGEVFNNAKNFWLNNGLALSRVDENIGIIETDWLESQPDVPKNAISSIISRIIGGLTDEGVRDKFRTRVDYDGEHSYVYLTHYGIAEKALDRKGQVVKSNNNRGDVDVDYAWLATSRNPELEIEMLRRLNLYLQSGRKPAAISPQSPQKSGNMRFAPLADGTPALMIDADFNQAWSLLGIAIDRAGYELTSQDRRNGTYGFDKVTETSKGFIFKTTQRDVNSYQIGLADHGQQQIAVIRSIDGNLPAASEAQSVLQKIAQEIRF